MPQREDKYEQWGESEEEDNIILSVPLEYREIKAQETKLTVEDLWNKYKQRLLNLEPDFQRHYVWDSTRASRYIESLLLQFPTPPIFLAEEKDGTLIVVDGHQRLETLFRFMKPLLSGPSTSSGVQLPYGSLSPLNLTGLGVLGEMEGKGVVSLSDANRKKLWDTKLTALILPQSLHPEVKYALFTRLNQGSMSLNNQEIRNCLYRGAYNQLIARLSEGTQFLSLWGKSYPDKRMRHRELVLRFFAFLHRIGKYKTPFRAFLDQEMEDNRDLSPEEQQRFQQQMDVAMRWVRRVFGGQVFKQFLVGNADAPAGRWVNRRYDLIYDVEMVGFANYGDSLDKWWGQASAEEQTLLTRVLNRNLAGIMTDQGFVGSINQGTTLPRTVELRFDMWLREVRRITREPERALEEGKELLQSLSQSNICPSCGHPIMFEDATRRYIRGGLKVTHRFCGRT
ncbi:MAG: DUF262 domain-containing protein [Chloroflexi bacterium]|nr:DUF262 domain-containing protein [Chloroflexota bacterium]